MLNAGYTQPEQLKMENAKLKDLVSEQKRSLIFIASSYVLSCSLIMMGALHDRSIKKELEKSQQEVTDYIAQDPSKGYFACPTPWGSLKVSGEDYLISGISALHVGPVTPGSCTAHLKQHEAIRHG